MAKPDKQPDNVLMAHETPLAKAEAEQYITQQKSADLNRNISQYMFWGATSIIGAMALSFTALTPLLVIGGVAASVATFLGSVFFSRKATDIAERSNVLYSDIDSQNQARRMVQGFARAQAQDASASAANDLAFTAALESNNKNWTANVGHPGVEHANTSWQSRISAEADREDAQALAAFSH